MCTHIHTVHAHVCTHTRRALLTEHLGLAGSWPLGNCRPRLWHEIPLLLLFVQGNRKWGWGGEGFCSCSEEQTLPEVSSEVEGLTWRLTSQGLEGVGQASVIKSVSAGLEQPRSRPAFLPESRARARMSSRGGASAVTHQAARVQGAGPSRLGNLWKYGFLANPGTSGSEEGTELPGASGLRAPGWWEAPSGCSVSGGAALTGDAGKSEGVCRPELSAWGEQPCDFVDETK